MKKSLNLILATAVATALAIPAFSADVTMRISLQLPMKSHLGQNLLLFKELVLHQNLAVTDLRYRGFGVFKVVRADHAVGPGF